MSLVKASFFEKLVQFFRIHFQVEIRDLIHITQVHYHFSQTAPPIQQTEPQKLVLNLKDISELPQEQQKEFAELIQGSVIEDGIPLLEEKSKERVEDIEVKENQTDVKPLLIFFKGKIRDEDYAALRAAIYIKKRFDEGAPHAEIYSLKGDLMAKFGSRGRKINNLFSSGYFESMIMPLYIEMQKDRSFSNEEFLRKYDLIINEEAFAVFVSGWITAEELAPIIHKKIKTNLRYGKPYITIHGIGRENIQNIRDVLPDIELNYSILERSIIEKHYIIIVTLRFNPNQS